MATTSLTPHELLRTANNLLHRMVMMVIDIQTPHLDLCQVFQYLQERSLLSMGALLYNPSPGITFDAVDMVRNLFLSHYTHLPMQEQEHIYRSYWLPLESHYSNTTEFNYFLQHYTTTRLPVSSSSLPPSPLEKHVLDAQTLLQSKGIKIDLSGAVLYTRFVTLYKHTVEKYSEEEEEEVKLAASSTSGERGSSSLEASAAGGGGEVEEEEGFSPSACCPPLTTSTAPSGPIRMLKDMLTFAEGGVAVDSSSTSGSDYRLMPPPLPRRRVHCQVSSPTTPRLESLVEEERHAVSDCL